MLMRRSGAACDTAKRIWCGSVMPLGKPRSASSPTGCWIGLKVIFDIDRQNRVSEPGCGQSHGLSSHWRTGSTWIAPLMRTSSGDAPSPETDW
jgi:hypothetical protein